MGRHRAGDAAPSSDWIERVLGKRHRLSRFHDPEGALASESALLRMYPHKSDVEDYAHRDEAYRNLGTSAALHVVRDVFADYDCYVLRLSEQRIIEHRPMRSNDALHSDVFIETREIVDGDDAFVSSSLTPSAPWSSPISPRSSVEWRPPLPQSRPRLFREIPAPVSPTRM